MLDLVRQIIDFYLAEGKEPTLSDLRVENQDLLGRKASLFVTIFHKGSVRGSAGNVKELEPNVVSELIKATVSAISNDSRFKPLNVAEKDDIKIRIDEITSRVVLDNKGEKDKNGKESDNVMEKLDPLKNGVLVIKKDYTKLAIVLPNISPLLVEGTDFASVLTKKLGENYNEADYIKYSIETNILTNY